MKTCLFIVSCLIASISAHAELLLTHGFVAFGDTDPFNGGGRVTVYDFNEGIPKFEVLLGDLSYAFNNPGIREDPFLTALPESDKTFEQIMIKAAYPEDKELLSSVGQFYFETDPGYGKGLLFKNTGWYLGEATLPVSEPASLLLVISGIGLIGIMRRKELPQARLVRC